MNRDAAVARLVEAVGEWRKVFGRPDVDFETRRLTAEEVMHSYDQLAAIPLEIPTESKVNTRAPLTAHWAAMSMRRNTTTVSMKVLAYIVKHPAYGATVDELEERLGLRHQTCSARVNELRNSGWIVACEDTRTTGAGRQAEVYRMSVQGRALFDDALRRAQGSDDD